MADYRRLRSKYSTVKAELDAVKAAQDSAKHAEHMREFEELKAYKANAEKAQAEAAREAVRSKNVDAILAAMVETQRADAQLILLGMQAKGEIDLYAEGVSASLIEKLSKDRPGWFAKAPNGAGLAGGAPGVGLPIGGSLLSLPADQLASLSDEQIQAHLYGPRGQTRRL